MILLHRVGDRFNSNFNAITEILACNEPLSFDGIYEEVLWHADELRGKDITLFVMGNYVGKTNDFDRGQPLGKFLTWAEIRHLAHITNAKIGWHTWSHRDLTSLSDDEVRREIATPVPMDSLAYPYGRVDARVARLVQEAGYKEAYAAGPYGDGSQFQKKRRYLNW